MIETRQEALRQITELATTHNITLDEIGASFARSHLKARNVKWVTLLFGYVGAALIFGGLALLLNMVWDDIDSISRVTLTYGPGIALFLLGILTLHDKRYTAASTPLFLQAAVLQPWGMFVFLDEFSNALDTQLNSIAVFGVLGLQFLISFLLYKRTSLLFFGFLFWNAMIGMVMDRAGIPDEALGITLGLSILLVAWSVDLTYHRGIAPVMYFFGGIGFLWAVFDLVHETNLDITYLPFSILMMLASLRIKSRTLLIVSTFGLLGFLAYYTDTYFKNIIGWPAALMFIGLLLVGITIFVVKRTDNNVKKI